MSLLNPTSGGGGGIRTHGPLAGTTVFKTVTIGHSDTPPVSRSTVRQPLVEGFLLDCKVTGKSLATIDYYTEKLGKFLWGAAPFEGQHRLVTSHFLLNHVPLIVHYG